MNLKTLKDFECHQENDDGCYCIDSNEDASCEKLVLARELRQNAIKWIKGIESDKINHTYYGAEPYECPISWIKHFFNITEEELNPQNESSSEK